MCLRSRTYTVLCCLKVNLMYQNCSSTQLIIVCIHIRTDPCTDGGVQLVNGFEGQLEICINGTWGTVCNDGFDTSAAMVVCR